MNCDLILLPGKLAGLLIYVYNMHPHFERGNNGQNCAYCNQIFTVHCGRLALADGCDPCSSDNWRARRFFLSANQCTISPISHRPYFTKFEHNTSIGITMKILETEFWKFYCKGSFFQKTIFWKIFSILQLQAAITTQWLQWLQIAGNLLPK